MRNGSKKLPPFLMQIPQPGVQVRIRPILRKDGTVDMTAELQYSVGGKHDWDISTTRSAKSEKEIPLIAAQMAAEISRRYAQRLHESAATTDHSDKPYSSAFDALDEEQRKAIVPPTRKSPKYIQQSLSELRIFLGILDVYGLGVEEVDLDAVVAARRQMAESNKNNIKDPETTVETVNASIKTFNVLYPALRLVQPDYHLPELHLPLLLSGRGARREQVIPAADNPFSINRQDKGKAIIPKRLLHKKTWHKQDGAHPFYLRFSQVEAFAQLCEIIGALRVIATLEARAGNERRHALIDHMGGLMCQGKPFASALIVFEKAAVNHNRPFGVNPHDLLPVLHNTQRVLPIGKETNLVKVPIRDHSVLDVQMQIILDKALNVDAPGRVLATTEVFADDVLSDHLMSRIIILLCRYSLFFSLWMRLRCRANLPAV